MTARPCFCGATEGVRIYKDGPCCPEHTPARLAGHPEPPTVPYEDSLSGMLIAAGGSATRGTTPAGVTAIDNARVLKGKTRSSNNGYRAVQAQHEERRRGDLRAVPARQEAATPPPPPHAAAGGPTVSPLDADRLSRQSRLVWDFLLDGKWHTLREISDATGAPEASAHARFKEFRSEEFGRQPMDAERMKGSSQWRYRLAIERLAKPQPA